jgi:hypothetical protein
VQRRRCKKIIKAKNHGIVSHIREQDRLKKEMEYMNTEKKVLEKIAKEKIEAMVVLKDSKTVRINN